MTEKKTAKPAKSEAFAVIATGGKQYVVHAGDKVKVERLAGAEERKAGAKITFEEVLLTNDGAVTKVGAPTVKGATVEAKLIEDGRDPKLHIQRFRSKSNYHRKLGHRQSFTLVEITKV